MLSFFLGIFIGCVAFSLVLKFYWIKKLKVTHQRLLREYDEKLQLGIRENFELEQQRQNLFSQLTSAQQEHLLIVAQYQTQYEKTKQEFDSELNTLMEQAINLEYHNRELKEENNQLILEMESISSPVISSTPQCQTHEEEFGLEIDTKFGQILQALLPNLIFLRNSTKLISESHNLVFLLTRLKAINDSDFTDCKKVRATDNEWFECRVAHISMMRIYFQKCKSASGKYQVLISPKKNQKTQDKDYEWLKQQTIC